MPGSSSHGASFSDLRRMVGHTPLMALRYRWQGQEDDLLVKCEQFNMTGSIKDRLALHALERAANERALQAGFPVLTTGSNLGIAAGFMGRALGYPVTVLLEQQAGLEFRNKIRAAGAALELMDTTVQLEARRRELAASGSVDLSAYLSDDAVMALHARTTGREIGHSLILENIRPAVWLSCTESGATLRGVAQYLKNVFPALEAYRVGIQERGSSAALIISRTEAAHMAAQLRRELSIGCGYTSGANVLAAIRLQQALGGRRVVTVLCDDHRRYPELIDGRIDGLELVAKRTLNSA